MRAPLAADVIHVAVQNGMSVSPQSAPLFVLLPRTPRIVRAELNESFLSAIHKGIPALLVNDDDAQTVIGHAHVLRLSPVFSTSAQDNDSGLQGSERTVECVLAVEGSAPLLVGQKVLVRFLTSSAETRLAP